MSITHHPSDETLLRYAAGTLAAGPALVVAAHLAASPASRARLRDFEALAGAMLEAVPPTALADDALARTLARLDAPAPAVRPAMAPPPDLPPGTLWPAPLGAYPVGRWRFLAPGVRWSRIEVPDPQSRVILMRVAGGMKLPAHGHSGIEYTCVLAGAFSDDSGRYGPGDLAEEDDDTDHQPLVEPGAECVCLIAMQGRTRPHGWLGRLVQPLLGF
ncbi:MAG TPA: ChrR family anti-sigma-E factor [Xanthobacteraceae bacterium]|nr:ChrR family anti-sigma-E factor [Xanthobacteraceae bacterium]